MRVRVERPGDEVAIAAVHEAAFGQPDEARIVHDLRGTPAFVPALSLVAEQEGAVVGHILFPRVGLEGAPRDVLALAPVGVVPERQGQGIGAALVRAGLEAAERLDEPLVIVLGHAAYYPRFGFEPARPLGIEAPFDVPDDAWMAARLPGWEPALRGRVLYPPPLQP